MLGGLGLLLEWVTYLWLHKSDVGWKRGLGELAGVAVYVSISGLLILLMIAAAVDFYRGGT